LPELLLIFEWVAEFWAEIVMASRTQKTRL
jgi:hypothetical protein